MPVVPGDAYRHDFHFTLANGDPRDITTEVFSAKLYHGSDGPELESLATATIMSGAGGVLRVAMSAADTELAFELCDAPYMRIRNESLEKTIVSFHLVRE